MKDNLILCNCRYEDFSGGNYRWGPGVRSIYIIHYVKSGKGFFLCNGKKYSLNTGQCFLIRPGDYVNYFPDSSDPWTYCWVDFSGEIAEDILRLSAFSKEKPILPENKSLISEFKFVCDNFSLGLSCSDARNSGLLRILLSAVIEAFPSGAKNSENSDFTEYITFIENNLHKPSLTAGLITENFHISRASLYRSFQKNCNTSPNKYITDLRIKKACDLLNRRDLSIKSIAFSVGFSDQLYFSKVFKKYIGLSPESYRKTIY